MPHRITQTNALPQVPAARIVRNGETYAQVGERSFESMLAEIDRVRALAREENATRTLRALDQLEAQIIAAEFPAAH